MSIHESNQGSKLNKTIYLIYLCIFSLVACLMEEDVEEIPHENDSEIKSNIYGGGCYVETTKPALTSSCSEQPQNSEALCELSANLLRQEGYELVVRYEESGCPSNYTLKCNDGTFISFYYDLVFEGATCQDLGFD